MNNLKADDVSGDTPGKFGRGRGGGLALVLKSYQYFRSHFLNQCSREKMKNKQTKNKTKILYMKENLQGTHQLRP